MTNSKCKSSWNKTATKSFLLPQKEVKMSC
jgi:hypothetical protein